MDRESFSKIDWAFINEEWIESMPSSKVIFLPEGTSDHCPAKVVMTEERKGATR